jgi:hypothetical protein
LTPHEPPQQEPVLHDDEVSEKDDDDAPAIDMEVTDITR